MGCVRRGKKQKQGTRTLTKEEATGVPSTSQRIHDNTNWAEVENRQLCKSFPSRMSSLYGEMIGIGAVLELRQHPSDMAKEVLRVIKEFSNKDH